MKLLRWIGAFASGFVDLPFLPGKITPTEAILFGAGFVAFLTALVVLAK